MHKSIPSFCFIAILFFAFGCTTPRISGYDVHGIDVSHYQGDIDWRKVKEQAIDFAFIKASEGENMQDDKFDANWEGTAEQSIARGAYHFFIPSLDPKKQAQNFISKVKLAPGDFPPVLDVESTNGLPSEQIASKALEWCKTVEAHYGIRPILYCNFNFYNTHLKGHFDEDALWLARYNSRSPGIDRDWKFWQYTDEGGLEGIDGYVDLNVFSGSLPEMRAMCTAP